MSYFILLVCQGLNTNNASTKLLILLITNSQQHDLTLTDTN